MSAHHRGHLASVYYGDAMSFDQRVRAFRYHMWVTSRQKLGFWTRLQWAFAYALWG